MGGFYRRSHQGNVFSKSSPRMCPAEEQWTAKPAFTSAGGFPDAETAQDVCVGPGEGERPPERYAALGVGLEAPIEDRPSDHPGQLAEPLRESGPSHDIPLQGGRTRPNALAQRCSSSVALQDAARRSSHNLPLSLISHRPRGEPC